MMHFEAGLPGDASATRELAPDHCDHTYERFALQPQYKALNRAFVRTLPLCAEGIVVDLASGPGMMAMLLREREPDSNVVRMDLTLDALAARSAPLSSRSQLIVAAAERIPLSDGCVQGVVIGNGIQLFDPVDDAIIEMARVLRSDGWLAFNTAFFAGTFTPGTEGFYLNWIQQALSLLKSKDAELRATGQPAIVRRRGTVGRAFSRSWISPVEYGEMLERHGFVVESSLTREVSLSVENLRAIGSYAGLASVLLSGYPTDYACDALESAVEPAVAATGLESISRQWLEIIARKPVARLLAAGLRCRIRR